MLILLIIGIGLWLWSQRLPILRVWYGFTPHPATDEVNAVINAGRPYNADRLGRLLAVAPHNPIEREVRMRQAADLLRGLHHHAEQTRAELDGETAYLKSQAGLAEGMEIHARIKRRLDTILRAQGKTA